MTPVPPVTALDEPWPFFLFWCHHFWPKLASSILNFCSRKRSFQWCPDQSDRLNRVLDMHKKAQKVEWKTQSKISCHYAWLLHAKNFDFCACPNHNALKHDAGGKKGKLLCCKCIFDWIKIGRASCRERV